MQGPVHAAQNVGGEMHIQVHPREADEPGQHKSRDAEPAVLQPERKGSGKGGGCVSGREGPAMGPGHQREHLRPEVAGRGRANSGFKAQWPASI